MNINIILFLAFFLVSKIVFSQEFEVSHFTHREYGGENKSTLIKEGNTSKNWRLDLKYGMLIGIQKSKKYLYVGLLTDLERLITIYIITKEGVIKNQFEVSNKNLGIFYGLPLFAQMVVDGSGSVFITYTQYNGNEPLLNNATDFFSKYSSDGKHMWTRKLDRRPTSSIERSKLHEIAVFSMRSLFDGCAILGLNNSSILFQIVNEFEKPDVQQKITPGENSLSKIISGGNSTSIDENRFISFGNKAYYFSSGNKKEESYIEVIDLLFNKSKRIIIGKGHRLQPYETQFTIGDNLILVSTTSKYKRKLEGEKKPKTYFRSTLQALNISGISISTEVTYDAEKKQPNLVPLMVSHEFIVYLFNNEIVSKSLNFQETYQKVAIDFNKKISESFIRYYSGKSEVLLRVNQSEFLLVSSRISDL